MSLCSKSAQHKLSRHQAEMKAVSSRKQHHSLRALACVPFWGFFGGLN